MKLKGIVSSNHINHIVSFKLKLVIFGVDQLVVNGLGKYVYWNSTCTLRGGTCSNIHIYFIFLQILTKVTLM